MQGSLPSGFSLERVLAGRTIRDFSTDFSARLAGFNDWQEYYARASSVHVLHREPSNPEVTLKLMFPGRRASSPDLHSSRGRSVRDRVCVPQDFRNHCQPERAVRALQAWRTHWIHGATADWCVAVVEAVGSLHVLVLWQTPAG